MEPNDDINVKLKTGSSVADNGCSYTIDGVLSELVSIIATIEPPIQYPTIKNAENAPTTLTCHARFKSGNKESTMTIPASYK